MRKRRIENSRGNDNFKVFSNVIAQRWTKNGRWRGRTPGIARKIRTYVQRAPSVAREVINNTRNAMTSLQLGYKLDIPAVSDEVIAHNLLVLFH